MTELFAARLLGDAQRAGRGVGAFNVIQLEHAEAFVRAAAGPGAPMILQISQNAVAYHGALEPLALACLSLARRADHPVVVHLDHAEDLALVSEAIALGVPSIMYDGSKLDYDENVARTAAVVAEAHAEGVSVEAELGEVGGKDGVHAPGVRTDPAEAVAFVEATGVDSLAVAVGSSHAMTSRDARLDFERISQLRRAVSVPLVLHGSSGVSDADLARAVESGITKVNISTRLNITMTAAITGFLAEHPQVVDPRTYVGAARDAITAEVSHLLGILRTTE